MWVVAFVLGSVGLTMLLMLMMIMIILVVSPSVAEGAVNILGVHASWMGSEAKLFLW